jgi:hypothetical protein
MVTDVPYNWLKVRGTPEEFENVALEAKAKAFSLPIQKVRERFGARPLGDMTDKWREFLKQMAEGDELWSFRSPEKTFAQKLGCAGYAIVRNGQIKATFVTLRT